MTGDDENYLVTYRGQSISLSARTRLGGSELIVFMHGFGCSKDFFDGAFESPDLRDYSLCAFDFPSHGSSDALEPASSTLESYAEIARSLIEQLSPNPGRATLVCHSMGGAIGLFVAQSMPGSPSFVSVEGNLIADDCGIVSRETAAQRQDEFVTSGYHSFLDSLQASPKHDLQAWARCYKQADSAGLHAIATSLVEWSDSGYLMKFFNGLSRRHYFHGEWSELGYLLPALDGTPIHLIPESGHFLMLDNPKGFYQAVAETVKHP
jgi:pimeloyl-ACP methyl ester carboxylesterase